MAVHFKLMMSDDLDRDIDKAVEQTGNSKSEVLRKALQLYLTALDGKKRGLKIGMCNAVTEKMQDEFIGF